MTHIKPVALLAICLASIGFLSAGCGDGPRAGSAIEGGTESFDDRGEGVRVRTGAAVLVGQHLELLRGKRVGLIANHTTLVDTTHLGDLLADAPDVELVSFFAPEHGIRGSAEAGEVITAGVDARTGLPVHSLYGERRMPTHDMLLDLDMLVFDIQDVGVRFYTYISTMGLSMQAAAEAGVAFVVLDRPNPLGGNYVGGFMMEPEHTSFVGQFAIPIAHGLTVGELARLVQGERLLPGLESLELHVVPMQGWSRALDWSRTGLSWIAPSPNLPDFETALVYPGTCLFEALNASEGRGTLAPFRQVGASYVDASALVQSLQRRTLPGVQFEPVTFTPKPIPQMASSPRFRDTTLNGVRITPTDPSVYQPVEVGLHVVEAFREQAMLQNAQLVSRPDWLVRLAGTERLGTMLASGATADEIIGSWKDEVERFRTTRRPYLIYD